MSGNIENKKANELAELFKTFGDSTRIKILASLYEKERSVNEITNLLEMNQSAISHQLKNLKNAKLIKNRRDGQTIYYSLDDIHVYTIIEQGLKHINE